MNTNTRMIPVSFHVAKRSFGEFHFCQLPPLGSIKTFEQLPDFVMPFVNADTGEHEHVACYIEKMEPALYRDHSSAVVGKAIVEQMTAALANTCKIPVFTKLEALPVQYQRHLRPLQRPEGGFAAQVAVSTAASYSALAEREQTEFWMDAMAKAFVAEVDQIMHNRDQTRHFATQKVVDINVIDGKLARMTVEREAYKVEFHVSKRAPQVREVYSNPLPGPNYNGYNGRHEVQFEHAGLSLAAKIDCYSGAFLKKLMTDVSIEANVKAVFYLGLGEAKGIVDDISAAQHFGA